MAASWLVVYRGLLTSAVLLGVGILYLAADQRGKPGFRPLLVLTTGGLVYVATKLSVSLVRGTPPVFLLTRFNPLGAGLATVGFALFVIEYTGIEQPVTRRTAALLLFVPGLVNTAVWLDMDYLWTPTGRDARTVSGYAWDLNSIAIVDQLYLNLVLIAGLVLLVRFGLRSTGPFAVQVTALVLAGVGPLVGNLLFYAGVVPFNLAPIVIVFSAGVILWVMVRGQLLDLVPISRAVVIDSVDTGALTVDVDDRVVDINLAARRLLGLNEDEQVIGRDIDTVFRNCTPEPETPWSRTDLDSGATAELEFGDRYYEIEATDLIRDDGRVRGRSFLLRDITEKKARREELERKNESLGRLVSVISHDIRNPLNVIHMSARAAGEGRDVETQLERIQSNAGRIEDILEDALTITRETEPTTVDLIDLSATAERAWSHVETAGVSLETADGFAVECDPRRIEQLFENFFRNAVEHGDSVTTVRVGELDTGDAAGRGFFVADDGVGIPAEDRQKVLEDGYTTSEDGTGLGLSIISGIIESHGWHMQITDSRTGGTRFEIAGVTTPAHVDE